MISGTIKKPIDEISKQVILPLLYFDIFSYPLTAAEIIKYTNLESLPMENVLAILHMLVENKILFRIDDFYLISDSPWKVAERLQNNKRALSYLPKARKMAKIISLFPFVKAVFVSGSLSKNVMPEDGDIDFFIITTEGRLWICRTLLIFFKKLFLFNSHKYFCLNYFIDESHLLIEEQNRYTATEIVTLQPMFGSSLYHAFLQENKWATDFYPHFEIQPLKSIAEIKTSAFQSFLGLVFSDKSGEALNIYLMQLTMTYWKRKFTSFDAAQFDKAFKSTPYVSKHHPNNFQEKVNNAFKAQIRNFEISHHIKFHEPIS